MIIKKKNEDVHFEHIPYGCIGLDRITLTNIQMSLEDIISLEQFPDVDIKNSNNCYYYIINDNLFFNLKIKLFCELSTPTHSKIYLNLFVKNENGTNLIPFTYTDYDNLIKRIVEHLHNEYGVTLKTDKAIINYMEINTNIQLKHSFFEYSRVFDLLFGLLPKTMKKKSNFKSANTDLDVIETISAKNESRKVMFYNKTKQLQEKKKADITNNNILRIEYAFLKPAKIKALFGTNSWTGLCQSNIEKVFISSFHKDFIKPFISWEATTKRAIKKLYKNGLYSTTRNGKGKQIHQIIDVLRNREILTGVPQILDLSQVFEAILELPEIKKLKNNKRMIKEQQQYQEQIKNNVFCNSDLAKIEEIFSYVEV